MTMEQETKMLLRPLHDFLQSSHRMPPRSISLDVPHMAYDWLFSRMKRPHEISIDEVFTLTNDQYLALEMLLSFYSKHLPTNGKDLEPIPKGVVI